jgi:hypothetical protein
LIGVPAGFPGPDATTPPHLIREPSIHAWSGQHREREVRHLEPVAMLGRVTNLQVLPQAAGVRRRQGGIQGGWRLRVQVSPP